MVSAATLYDEKVAVKQMQVKQLTRPFAFPYPYPLSPNPNPSPSPKPKADQVKQLTRSFATVFLTEAECLSHCRHPHIVRFVGGCVAPPLVCLVLECCDTSVHRLVHPSPHHRSPPPNPSLTHP